jgi:hypothetical protein
LRVGMEAMAKSIKSSILPEIIHYLNCFSFAKMQAVSGDFII